MFNHPLNLEQLRGAHGTYLHLVLEEPNPRYLADILRMEPRTTAGTTAYIRTAPWAIQQMKRAGKCAEFLPFFFTDEALSTWWHVLCEQMSPQSALVLLDECEGLLWEGRAMRLDNLKLEPFMVSLRREAGVKVKDFDGPVQYRRHIELALALCLDPASAVV